ncbi:MAG: WG repeat-containing protein [Moheibacter sp.]
MYKKLNITILLILCFINIFGQNNRLYEFQNEDGKYGFINSQGKIIIEPKYLIVNDFSDGLSFVSKEVIKNDYKWVCIDTLGNEIFDIKDNFPDTNFSEGFARIKNFEEHWFINKNGENEFGKTWKDGFQNFKNGVAYVSDIKFKDFYPIDMKGNRIGEQTFSRVEIYNSRKEESKIDSPNLIAFEENGLWGFKSKNGTIIIRPQFYKVDKFENGICGVLTEKQLSEIENDYYLDAIIDEKGNILSKQPMHCYMGFEGELIRYYLGPHFSGGPHYLNKFGQKIIPKK